MRVYSVFIVRCSTEHDYERAKVAGQFGGPRPRRQCVSVSRQALDFERAMSQRSERTVFGGVHPAGESDKSGHCARNGGSVLNDKSGGRVRLPENRH